MDLDPYSQLIADISAAEEFQRIRDYLTARTASVNSQLDALARPPGIILLDDGFEAGVWDANWNDISHNWLKDTGTTHSGSASAWADDYNNGDFTCDALDTSDANAIYINFWIMKDDTETVEDIILSYYN